MVEVSIAYGACWAMSEKSREDDIVVVEKRARWKRDEKNGIVHDESNLPAGSITTNYEMLWLKCYCQLSTHESLWVNSNDGDVDVDVDDDELRECVPRWRSDERGLQWVESRVWLPWTRCWAETRSWAKMITDSDVEFDGVKSHVGWKRVRVQGTRREMLG